MRHIPNINYTIQHDLCMGCGICEGACPFRAITMEVRKGRFFPMIDSDICHNDKGCHRCYDSCGGLGIDLMENARRLHTCPETKENEWVGRFIAFYTGYSEDEELRESAASGGVVSQFLIWLLDNGKIDGAVVTRFDKESPLKVNTFIATSKEEFLSAKGSKYGPVSMHHILNQIKQSEANRFVVVGLPCHVHSLRKLMSCDKKLRNKIVGIFSLFCSGTQNFYYTEYIIQQCGGNVESLDYLAYREGSPSGMVAKGKGFEFFKQYTQYNVPLKSTFYPRRCLLCVDMFGELADISFGDIHMDNVEEAGSGISAVIARNRQWLDLLQEAVSAKVIHLDEISLERMLYKRPMAKVKKTRNASFVELLKFFHQKAPIYDSKYHGRVTTKTVLRYAFMRLKQYVGNHRMLWFLLPKIN